MGRRTQSAEAAWTPQIAHHVRHELMDLVHKQRRDAYKRLDELEAEAGPLAEDLDDADRSIILGCGRGVLRCRPATHFAGSRFAKCLRVSASMVL